MRSWVKGVPKSLPERLAPLNYSNASEGQERDIGESAALLGLQPVSPKGKRLVLESGQPFSFSLGKQTEVLGGGPQKLLLTTRLASSPFAPIKPGRDDCHR